MVDIVVIAAVALGAFAGWRRGFIMPLVAVASGLTGLYLLYAGPGAGVVPTGTAGIGLGVLVVSVATSFIVRIASMLAGLVHRVALLRAADHTLGVPLGAVTALLSVYLALVAVVSFDDLIAPLHGKATIDQAAVAAMRSAMSANPQFSVMLDQGTLDAFAAQAATSAIPAEQVAQFNATLGFYESTVRPALVGSVLAPAIVSVGEHLPFLGRHLEFPAK